MDEIIIRKAEKKDAKTILDLFNFEEDVDEVTDKSYVENSIKQNESGSISLVVAEIKGKIAGAIKLKRKRNHIGNIGKIAVSKEFQGKGIATTLYKVAIIIFSKENRTKVSDQMTEPNEPMVHLFNKLGFTKEGTLRMHTHDKKDVSLYAYFIDESGVPELPDNVKIKMEMYKNG
ncbi:MAG: GNAT family N-acetyltransferase [Candidatus Aenigmarchaeota archaeon]|nr:GNAT family N-acetyltransferase [Candidatus Aenigmarchaeota archaeon]